MIDDTQYCETCGEALEWREGGYDVYPFCPNCDFGDDDLGGDYAYRFYRLKTIRKEQRLTLRDVTKNASIDFTEYMRYEKGEPLSVDKAERIAAVLGMSLDELLQRENCESY